MKSLYQKFLIILFIFTATDYINAMQSRLLNRPAMQQQNRQITGKTSPSRPIPSVVNSGNTLGINSYSMNPSFVNLPANAAIKGKLNAKSSNSFDGLDPQSSSMQQFKNQNRGLQVPVSQSSNRGIGLSTAIKKNNSQDPQVSDQGWDIQIETPYLDAISNIGGAVSNAAQSAYATTTQGYDDYVAKPIRATANNVTNAATTAAKNAAIATAKTTGQYLLDTAGIKANIHQDSAPAVAGKVASYFLEPASGDTPPLIGPLPKSASQIFTENISPSAYQNANALTNKAAQQAFKAVGNAAGVTIDPNQHPAAVAGQIFSHVVESTPVNTPPFIGPLPKSAPQHFTENISPQARQNINTHLNKGAQQVFNRVGTAAKKSILPDDTGKEPESESFIESLLKSNKATQAAQNRMLNEVNSAVKHQAKKQQEARFNPQAQPDNIKRVIGKDGTKIEVMPAIKQNKVPIRTDQSKASQVIDVPTGDLFGNNLRLDLRNGTLRSVYLGKSAKPINVTFDTATGLYTAETKYSDASIDFDPLQVNNKKNKIIKRKALDLIGISGMSEDIANELMRASKPVKDNTLTVTFNPKTNIVTQKLVKKSNPNDDGETGATITSTTNFTLSPDQNISSRHQRSQIASLSQQFSNLFVGAKRYVLKTPEGVKNLISKVSNSLAKKLNLSQQEAIAVEYDLSRTTQEMSSSLANTTNAHQFNIMLKSWMNSISTQYINFVDKVNAVRNPLSPLAATKTMVLKGSPTDRFFPEITLSSNPNTNKLKFATFENNGKTYKLIPGEPDENGVVTLEAQIEHKDLAPTQQLAQSIAGFFQEKIITDGVLNGITTSNLTHAYPSLKNSILNWYYGDYTTGYNGIKIKYDTKQKTVTTTINQIISNSKPDSFGNYTLGYVPKTVTYPIG